MEITQDIFDKILFFFNYFDPNYLYARFYLLGPKWLIASINSLMRLSEDRSLPKSQVMNMFYNKGNQLGHREILMITPRNSDKFSKKLNLFEKLAKRVEHSQDISSDGSECYKPLSVKHWRLLLELPKHQLSQTVLMVDSLDLNLMKTVLNNQNKLIVLYTGVDCRNHAKVIQETFEILKTNANKTAFPVQLLKKEDLVLHKDMKNKILVKLYQKMHDLQSKFLLLFNSIDSKFEVSKEKQEEEEKEEQDSDEEKENDIMSENEIADTQGKSRTERIVIEQQPTNKVASPIKRKLEITGFIFH
jgi:hypothetical protein